MNCDKTKTVQLWIKKCSCILRITKVLPFNSVVDISVVVNKSLRQYGDMMMTHCSMKGIVLQRVLLCVAVCCCSVVQTLRQALA